MTLTLAHISPPTGYTAPLHTAFIEYPKYIHVGEGKDRVSHIVYDKAEEEAILSGQKPKTVEPSAPVGPAAPINNLTGPNDEEGMLRKIAADKGIHIDGRWKLPKIRKAVEAASS